MMMNKLPLDKHSRSKDQGKGKRDKDMVKLQSINVISVELNTLIKGNYTNT
jgi:hypothetical protein